MNTQTLHSEYLAPGMPGNAIVRRFHFRYADVLARAGFGSVDDVMHEVLLSVAKTDFAAVRNVEHYVLRAVKLQCWSLLDKALRQKRLSPESRSLDQNEETLTLPQRGEHPAHLGDLEGMELLANLNLFKGGLEAREARLLNLLIDGSERAEMARLLGLNMNTLDTNIRRLRIRLADFLRSLGYSYETLERFT